MISVDDRAGSAQLAPKLRSLGCEVDLTRMDFGDVSWMGTAHDGQPVSVGVEVKSITDVIACITSGRFSGHQLPGLLANYDHIWLLVEGSWYGRRQDGVLVYKRQGPRGDFWCEMAGQRTWLARDLESWLLTNQVLAGIRVHRVANWDEAALWLKTCYNWFQKDFHSSHRVLYEGKHLFPEQALLTKPSLARRVAAQLPGIGDVRSASVAKVMHTIEEMVMASPQEWAEIEVADRRGGAKRLGKAVATKIHQAIHRNGNGK